MAQQGPVSDMNEIDIRRVFYFLWVRPNSLTPYRRREEEWSRLVLFVLVCRLLAFYRADEDSAESHKVF